MNIIGKTFILTLVFVFVNTTVIPTIRDEEAAEKIDPFGKFQVFQSTLSKEYELEYFVKVNWYTAFLSCVSRGLRLATITSQEEQTYLDQLIEYHGMESEMFWISGTDLAQEGKFSWFSSGLVFRFTNWAPRQPDNMNGAQHCVIANYPDKRAWDDTVCNYTLSYICERNF